MEAMKDYYMEARAYVKYKDANGNLRYNLDTYGKYSVCRWDMENELYYDGGCMTSFNEVYTALNGSYNDETKPNNEVVIDPNEPFIPGEPVILN